MSKTSVFFERPPKGFGVCVHRGTRQIGGTCIELACEGQRILLDLGLPLDAGDDVGLNAVDGAKALHRIFRDHSALGFVEFKKLPLRMRQAE